MQCPQCGITVTAEEVFCGNCGARILELEPSKAPKRSFVRILISAVLVLIAVAGILFSLKDNIRLSGTWKRYFKTDHTNVTFLQQYEFTPFGIMSQTSGDTTVRGSYTLAPNTIHFSPGYTDIVEDISYEITLDGKLYLNGDREDPLWIDGISLSLFLFLISVLVGAVGAYIFFKKPAPRFPEDTELDEEWEEDPEEVILEPLSDEMMPKWVREPVKTAPCEDTTRRWDFVEAYQDSPEPSAPRDSGFFRHGGDL